MTGYARAMRWRPFRQVDVFTRVPYRGNPLAVVLDGEGLSTEEMQRFTDWTNLSEATFLLPPSEAGRIAGAHYRVRIFCPGRELPFAGHPTLGSCHAWMEARQGQGPAAPASADDGIVVQECGAGMVRIRRDGPRLAFAAPPLLRSGPLPEDDVARIARGLGVARAEIVRHAWCDNGPRWQAVMLRSAEQVLALRPDPAAMEGLEVGVVGPWSQGEAAFEIRAFFPGNGGLAEDPVTGSLSAAVARWLIGAGLAPSCYVVAQGTALGRAGRVHVQQDGGDIWVGGETVTCISGTVRL
jgi:PhzF family phenazine biosynthesis protein